MPTIDVFGDIWCPFTHVGLMLLDEERHNRGRTDVVFDVRAWPLEWVNGAPMDPERVARNINALRTTVAPGLFRGFEERSFPTSTLGALDLVAAARRTSIALGESVSFALRRALFEEGRNVADRDVLEAIAHDVGGIDVTPAARSSVHADYDEGIARSVIGSPHFFVGEVSVFCPALSINHDSDGTVSIGRDEPTMTAFLDAIFEVS